MLAAQGDASRPGNALPTGQRIGRSRSISPSSRSQAAFSKAVSTKAARNPTVTTSPAVPAQSPKRRSSWEALRSFVDEQGARRTARAVAPPQVVTMKALFVPTTGRATAKDR